MKRINFKLILGLFIGLVVISSGSYFLRAFQVERNAGDLWTRAEEALNSGDQSKAAALYDDYLRFRDDPAAYSRLSKILSERAMQPDVSPRDFWMSVNFNEKALRLHDDLRDVRRSQVDLNLRAARFKDAHAHLEILRKTDPTDSSLAVKYALCEAKLGKEVDALAMLKKLVGYDDATDSFDVKKATGPKELDAYKALSELLFMRFEQKVLAEQVIDQMIAANADSSKAYLARGAYRFVFKKGDGSREDFDKAIELDPNSKDAILAWSEYAISQKRFDEARQRLKQGIEKHPKETRLYAALSNSYLQDRKSKEAIGALRDGIKVAPENAGLHDHLAELLLETNDLEGAQATITDLAALRIAPEAVMYLEGRLLVKQRKWQQARGKLETVRPSLSNYRRRQAIADCDLATCYGQMGLFDKQTEAYKRALDRDPTFPIAIAGYADSLERLGKRDDARKLRGQLGTVVAERGVKSFPLAVDAISRELARQKALPEADRNYAEADRLLAELLADKQLKVTEAQKVILECSVIMAKGDFLLARRRIADALRLTPKEASLWATLISIIHQEPRTLQEKTQETFQVLDLAQKDLGDVPFLRQLRAESIALSVRYGVPRETAAGELAKLEEGADKFQENTQTPFWIHMAATYNRIRDYDNARRCWKLVEAKRPDDVRVANVLFRLAADYVRLDDMKAELATIKKLEGEGGPPSKFAEATYIVISVKQRKMDLTALADARRLLDDVVANRPTWHEPTSLLGEIDEMEGKFKESITNYEKTLELGPPNAQITQKLALLKYRIGDVKGASELFKDLDPSKLDAKSRLVQSEIESRLGNVADAITASREAVEREPENAENHLVHGRTLAFANRMDEAEAAFRQAVQVNPKLPLAWMTLIHHLMRTKKSGEVPAVMEQVSAALPEVDAAVVLAEAYEALGEMEKAEEQYKAVIKAKPESLLLARTMVSFYTRLNRPDDAKPFLEQLVSAKLKPGEPQYEHAAWGRREKAIQTARGGGHRDVIRAVEMISQNAVNGRLTSEDLHVQAVLLGERGDRQSRNRAIQILDQIKNEGGLNPDEKLLLAQLYFNTGRWEESRALMQDLTSGANSDPRYIMAFGEMLYRRGEIDAMVPQIKKLDEQAPAALGTLQLKAQMLYKQGKLEQFMATMQNLIGGNNISRSDLPKLVILANLLATLDQQAAGEKLLRDYVRIEPRGALALAAYLGRYGELDEAMELCERGRRSQPLSEVTRVALGILRIRAGDATKTHFATVDGWLKTSLEEEPDSASLLIAQAELRDIEGRSGESIALYRKAIASPRAVPAELATARNNLAFLLAVNESTKDRAPEALKLVEEAIGYFGPTGDILDTRGMVHLAAGDIKKALSDLKLATTDTPSGSKFFHLALAEKQSGDKEAAKASFAKAKAEKLDPKALVPAERQKYAALAREFAAKK